MEWKKITDGLPPIGVPLVVTIEKNEYYTSRETRFPVYYSESKNGNGYSWYWHYGDMVYELLLNVSEVIAWAKLPKVYTEEVKDE